MMKIIPFVVSCLSACLLLVSCNGIPPRTAGDLPVVRTPAGGIPELWAWFGGHTPLAMGADSACGVPVVVFPEVAALCGRCGPMRNGFPTAPVGVSWAQGCSPIVAYSHVVTAHGAPVKGLIGWPVIRRFVWHLDLQHERHLFTHALPASVSGWNHLQMVDSSSVARVRLPGCGECIIDTGAPHGLYLSHEEWLRFLVAHPEAEVGIYFGESPAAGGFFSKPYTKVRSLRLGPLLLRDIRVCESFSPRTGPLMLGREALKQFDIWVDGPALRFYYRPLPPPAAVFCTRPSN